jgi:hypothetical protein
MSRNEDTNAVDARTIVELIRAQSWKNSGALLVEEADAIRLVATALRVAQDRGVIDGMGRMDAIAGKAFAPAAGAHYPPRPDAQTSQQTPPSS